MSVWSNLSEIVVGGQWWSLGGAHHSFYRSPRFRYVPTPRSKKLWSAPPIYHHRLLRTPGPRISGDLRSKRKKLRSAPPRLHHRPPQKPRPRKESIPTPRRKKLRSAQPRLRLRPPRTPRPCKECTPTPRRYNLKTVNRKEIRIHRVKILKVWPLY